MQSVLPYAAGVFTSAASYLSFVQPTDYSIYLQAGMTGVVIIILLKFFPMILTHMKETNERHEETIRHLVSKHDAQTKDWQRIIQERN